MIKGKRILAGMLAACMLFAAAVPGRVLAAQQEEITIESKDDKVPVYQAGKSQKWEFVVTNHTEQEMKNVVISPDMGENADAWPFKTDVQKCRYKIDSLAAGSSMKISFTFQQRDDVPTTRYALPFVVSVDGEEKLIQKFYVNTTQKPQEEAKDVDSKGTTKTEVPQEASLASVSNDDMVYSSGGGEGTGSTSVPRVIVTGFSTNPKEVRAGSNFTLTIHLKNTSKSTRVKNMLFDLNAPTEGTDEQTMAPAFLPASGSSSIYLEGIKANGTADISIDLNAKSDLLQKPYSIELSMKYEDKDGAQIEAISGISIPVKQDARFELSEFELSPDSIAVGDEANIMCSLYNLGRIKLYNVKAVFEGTCIKKEEIFIGNVESGTTASIDAMLEGIKATNGPEKITMTLSYEDESGSVSEKKEEFQLSVTEAEEEVTDVMEEPEVSRGFPIIPILIILAAIAVAAVVVIIKRKKKKQTRNEEEELLYELDGPSEDEQQ
ncbi:MAG: COG1361 S-layer family protein [Dorea sp.]